MNASLKVIIVYILLCVIYLYNALSIGINSAVFITK
jgi:hypothetical protein